MLFDRGATLAAAVFVVASLSACSGALSDPIKPPLDFQKSAGFTVTTADGQATVSQDVASFDPKTGTLPAGIAIDTATEGQVAGKTIQIDITAHAAKATNLIANYFTLGYGNSGPTSLAVGTASSTASFKYSVPKPTNPPNKDAKPGDYLAIYPSEQATPIVVESVTLTVQN